MKKKLSPLTGIFVLLVAIGIALFVMFKMTDNLGPPVPNGMAAAIGASGDKGGGNGGGKGGEKAWGGKKGAPDQKGKEVNPQAPPEGAKATPPAKP